MAPEQCAPSKDKGKIAYSFPVDVWALGVTVYETCALKTPFEGPTPYSIYKLIESAVYYSLPDLYSHHLFPKSSEYPLKQLQFTILFVISI